MKMNINVPASRVHLVSAKMKQRIREDGRDLGEELLQEPVHRVDDRVDRSKLRQGRSGAFCQESRLSRLPTLGVACKEKLLLLE